MSEVEWTNDTVVKLMEEYKRRPELWDSTNELYRLQTAKYEAWNDLANLFNCDIADLRKKLNSIFASHRREKAKVRCGGKTHWFLYPFMKFLPSHLENENNSDTVWTKAKGKPSRQSQVSDNDNSNDDFEPQEAALEQITVKLEPHNETLPMPKIIKYSTMNHRPRLTRPIRRKVVTEAVTSQLDNRLLETLKLLRRSDLTRKKDECDSFGEYIADSLRKHDERTQSMIKQAINNILFEQEMKKYSVGQYAVVISDMDENPLILGDTEPSDPTKSL